MISTTKTTMTALCVGLFCLTLAACGGGGSNGNTDNNNDGDGGNDNGGNQGQDLIAPFDNDSLQNPAQTEFLRITGTRDFTHTDEVSAPAGDADDFVEFEFPNNSNPNQLVRITLDAVFSEAQNGAQLRATIFEDDVETTKFVIANTGEQTLTVDNTKVQSVRVHFAVSPSGGEQTLAEYVLQVVGFN